MNKNSLLFYHNFSVEIEYQKYKSKESLKKADIQLFQAKLSQMNLVKKERDELLIKYQQKNSINIQLKSEIENLKKTNENLNDSFIGKFDLGLYKNWPIGAIANTLLFLCVSIPLMEGRQLKNKPSYAEYKKKTGMLIPKLF